MHELFGKVLALDDTALMYLAVTATVAAFGLALLLRSLVPVILNLVAGFQVLEALLAVGTMMLRATSACFWVGGIDAMMAAEIAIAISSSVIWLLVPYHLSLPAHSISSRLSSVDLAKAKLILQNGLKFGGWME